MSKETKLAKKEAKLAKKNAKAEKKQVVAYNKLVKDINKKNAKAEKKANKKNKPFVPAVIPTMEEAFATAPVKKGKQITKMIILLLLIAYVIYFLIMWFKFVAPIKTIEQEEEDGPSAAQEYDRYENEHLITTTPTYSVSEAKYLLKQVLHDNWQSIGYSSDPSSNSINYTGMTTVNNADCFKFSASGKSYAVSSKLSAVYVMEDGKYNPLTFHQTKYLF